MTRYVELIRVSSTGQAERDTPADQRRALDRLAEARPGRLVERIDHGARGLSGAADLASRPDLQRLAELSRARAYDELRVRHIDRLTRHDDPRERFAIFGMVADAGAVIVDAGGSVIDPKSEMGEVFYFLQTWGSANERRKIVQRTVEARKRLASQGRPMTRIPYGRRFDYAAGVWSLDAREVAVYRRIFREVTAGTSLHKLAAKLNREGVTAPKGGPWEASSLRRMILTPASIGRITSYGHPIDCPPVVDELTQRRAVAAMAQGRTRSGPVSRRFALLRQIATCAECGSTMHVVPGTRLYYRCAKAKPRACAHRTHHPVEEVDAAFVAALRQGLKDPARLMRGAIARPAGDAGAVRREFDRLERREEALVRLHTQGEVTPAVYRKQREEVAALRNDATARLAALYAAEAAAATARDHAHDVRAAIDLIRRRLARASPEDWRRLVVQVFPRRPGTWVRIHPDGSITTAGLLRLGKPGRLTSEAPQFATVTLQVAR